MGIPVRVGLALFLGLLVAVHSQANAPMEPQVEFSAESITESGGATLKEKVYYAPGKIRRELDVGHGKQVEIVRLDKNLAWLLMTEEKLYLERGLSAADGPMPSSMTFERTLVGEDMLEGIPADKYHAVAKQADGARLSGYVWSTKEGIMVKMDLEAEGSPGSRLKMELKNLKIGPVDAKVDVWHIAVMLYEALIGRNPFGGGLRTTTTSSRR